MARWTCPDCREQTPQESRICQACGGMLLDLDRPADAEFALDLQRVRADRRARTWQTLGVLACLGGALWFHSLNVSYFFLNAREIAPPGAGLAMVGLCAVVALLNGLR